VSVSFVLAAGGAALIAWFFFPQFFGKGHGIELTPDTWEDAVAGKTVFIKFLAPW